jgi:hypothetical protein
LAFENVGWKRQLSVAAPHWESVTAEEEAVEVQIMVHDACSRSLPLWVLEVAFVLPAAYVAHVFMCIHMQSSRISSTGVFCFMPAPINTDSARHFVVSCTCRVLHLIEAAPFFFIDTE